MTRTDILMDYFRRENDNIYTGGKQIFIHNYDSFQIMKGGAVTNTINRNKKQNRQKRLEHLNTEIRKNKKQQVKLLYDVTFEQINIENEEDITNTQTQLDSELKRLDKEREKIKKEIEDENSKNNDIYKQEKMDIEINMEILKGRDHSVKEKQNAYMQIETSLNVMYNVRTKRDIFEVDVDSSSANRISLNKISQDEEDVDLEITELTDE